MHTSYGSATSPAKRVRLLWAEFESWADAQRKTMHRRREEIAKVHDSKWKLLPIKNRTRPEEYDAQKAKALREVVEDHFANAREEWHSRLSKHNLIDQDWGELTIREQQQIEKVLGGDLEVNTAASVVQNVPVQPQYSNIAIPSDTVPPPPPLSPTARIFNASASTTSSYTLVNPNEFSTDDEYFEPGSSYVVPTDESEDEPFPNGQDDVWGVGTGRGERRSGSSSSTHDDFFATTSLPSKNETTNSAPSKRSSDVTDRKGKSRTRGPTYVGPRLTDPEEGSEEEEFELFKMQTRVTKIWEFHLAAARHGVELAMTIQNNRMVGKPGKADNASLVEAHEKQMLKLQNEKEEERKGIVAAERKKRREAIRKRSILVDTGRAANAAITNQEDWEETFTKGQSVRLDPEKRQFIIRKDEPSEENSTWEAPSFESASDLRTPTLPGSQDTIRARKQSLSRATPSGWKMKASPASATVSQRQNGPSPPTTSTTDFNTVPSWMEEAFSGTALDSSSGSDDFELPGSFPSASTSVPPIPSGWGPQKSTSPATELLKKALTNPTSSAQPPTSKNKNSPLSESHLKATAEPNPAPAPSTASTSNNAKKQNKKGRQAANQKKGAGGGPATTVEEEPAANFPGMPSTQAATTASINNVNLNHHLSVSPKDILQMQQRFSTQAEDELSTTPRPQHLTMKRVMGGGSDYTSDAAPTPRMSAKRLGGLTGAVGSSSGTGTSPWTTPQEAEMMEETPWQRAERLKSLNAPGKRGERAMSESVGNGWGHVPPMSMEAEMMRGSKEKMEAAVLGEQQETVWQRAQRLKTQGMGQGQAPLLPKSVQRIQEESMMFERGMMSQSAGPRSSGVPMSSPFGQQHQEETMTPWERQMMAKTQQAQREGATSAFSMFATPREEETVWNQVMNGRRGQGGEPSSSSMTSMAVPQQQTGLEETPWERMARLKAGMEQASEKQRPEPEKTPWEHVMGSKALSGASSSKSAFQPASAHSAMHSAPPQPSGSYWSTNGAMNHPQMWNTESHSTLAVGGGMMKGGMAMREAAKRVTVEEVPDEDGPTGRKAAHQRLPSNSRVILDIAEPKPSAPATMYTSIIHYGEEEEEEEYDAGWGSSAPTPSTAPTSPPNDVPPLDDDEAWLKAAAENAKNGNWDSLLNGGAFDGSASLTALKGKQKQSSRWPPVDHHEAKQGIVDASPQMFDSAELFSALQSVESPARVAPTKAAPASAPKKSSPLAAVSAPAPPAPKAAPVVASTAPPAAAPEKPEPAPKANNNQNQGKGKGKGKGKGRK